MSDKITPFTFIASINEGRKGKSLLIDCPADNSHESVSPNALDKQYVSFVINRSMSYFRDTVLFANEMNIRHTLPPRMQYDFYRNIVSPKRRFAKWSKKAKTSEDIKIIQKAYNYSQEKAESVHPLFSSAEINKLYAMFDKGGR